MTEFFNPHNVRYTVSAIRHALQKLDGALERLEGSVEGIESVMQGKQRDMFQAPPSNQNASAAPAGNVSGAIITRRLDSAIEKVEQILKEARG